MFRKGHPVFCCKRKVSRRKFLTVTASGEITVDNSSDDGVKPTVSEFTTVSYIQ